MEAVPTPTVSLVIPARNAAATLDQCLDAVAVIRERSDGKLQEILLIDDGSTDDTRTIAAARGARVIAGEGRGPGAARNTGWRLASSELVWFVDADCVAEPDALTMLLPHMRDEHVGGVSGSYGIMNDHSLLARLIHEEIIERHLRMGRVVDFLATFNVLYRRSALEQVGGFDERYLKGQDAELSFRVHEAGYELHFEIASRVRHFHEERWLRYLRTQRQQGYWRVFLHLEHAGHARGDSYSNVLDHAQPVLAMGVLASSPLIFVAYARWLPLVLLVMLACAPLPMTWRIIRRTRSSTHLLFAWMSIVRAFWRGVGMSLGTLRFLIERRRTADRSAVTEEGA